LSSAGEFKNLDIYPVFFKKAFFLGSPQRRDTRINESNSHVHLSHLSRGFRLKKI